jgi:hypothetical protein
MLLPSRLRRNEFVRYMAGVRDRMSKLIANPNSNGGRFAYRILLKSTAAK